MASGLKSSIVIKNQFTVKSADGSGSRGKTPAQYVLRYMARMRAVETVAPIKYNNIDAFIARYMARADAVEEFLVESRDGGVDSEDAPRRGSRRGGNKTSRLSLKARRAARSAARAVSRGAERASDVVRRVTELKGRFRESQGQGGISFGSTGVSLSHTELHGLSEQIQENFDSGHTVMKTVISFDHDYLQRHKLVPDDLLATDIERGSYRGQLDQMKLRMALMHGFKRMEMRGGYDNLLYVGVIQVDTAHVHAHLAMVDTGTGRLLDNGEQRGKLTAKDKAVFRRGVDSWLDEHQKINHLSSAVGYERRNVVSHIKRWAYETMSVEATGQLLLAVLPDDQRLWRAGSNDKRMARANAIATELVEQRLDLPGSPMTKAMTDVVTYARERRMSEGLTRAEERTLIDNGRRQIIERCVNGVYGVFRTMEPEDVDVSTPLLEAMSAETEDLMDSVLESYNWRVSAVSPDPATSTTSSPSTVTTDAATTISTEEFSLRLRSWNARLAQHRAMREDYHARAQSWRMAQQLGQVTAESAVMYRFYLSEEDYHARCQSKYQHFLAGMTGEKSPEWVERWQQVLDYEQRVRGLEALRGDRSIAKMSDPEMAEALGEEMYGQSGGRLLAATGESGRSGREMIDSRIARMRARHESMVDQLRVDFSRAGGRLEVDVDVENMDRAAVEADGAIRLDETTRVVLKPEHDIEEVKGLDMHDMGTDWVVNQPVGVRTQRRYQDAAVSRRQALEAARGYLQVTGQDSDIATELGYADADISRMENTAQVVITTGELPSQLGEMVEARRLRREAAARQRAQQEAQRRAEAHAASEVEQGSSLEGEPEYFERKALTMRVDQGMDSRIVAAVYDSVRETPAAMSPDGRGLGE